MSPGLMLILLIFFLLAIGTPIAFVLGIPSTAYIVLSGHNLTIIASRMYEGVDKFVLIAIPLFFLLGETMNLTGLSDKIMRFVNLYVGGFRGGLAHANVVSSILFSGMTGTGVGDVAAIGNVFIPAMKKQGYPLNFSAAVTAASAVIGPTMPPSVVMIIYGYMIGVSIGGLFLAGVLPGVMIGFGCMIVNWVFAKKYNYPKVEQKSRLKEYTVVSIQAIPSLLTPLIILGGMLSGFFTPTEAAAIAVAWAFFLGICYRTLKLDNFYKVIVDSAEKSSVIMLIISLSTIMSWIFAIMGITPKIVDLIQAISTNYYLVLFMILLFVMIMGMFLDIAVIIILFGPILAPVVHDMGMNPLHFGITMIVAVNIGMITPPMGSCLFASCAVARIRFEELVRVIWPFVLIEIGVLFVIASFEGLALFLPRLFGF
jgi:tripartite ATP-independent transporter DctM subunit